MTVGTVKMDVVRCDVTLMMLAYDGHDLFFLPFMVWKHNLHPLAEAKTNLTGKQSSEDFLTTYVHCAKI